MLTKRHLTAFILLTSAFGGTAWAHGHIPALDENDPLAADVRLCNDVADAALQALKNRDRGRPLALHEGSDLRTHLINEVSSHVYAEPQIRSPKFAMSYGRARCNEVLLEEKEKTATPR